MAALAAALFVLVHSAPADTATFDFDIPREDLALALNQIAQQSHIEIAYSAELTRGKTSPSLKGTYTPEEALKLLLKGSGLHVRRIAGGALVIEKAGTSPSGGQRPTSQSDATTQMGEIIVTASKRARKISAKSPVRSRHSSAAVPLMWQWPRCWAATRRIRTSASDPAALSAVHPPPASMPKPERRAVRLGAARCQ
jgi:Secretin and TonB N terminus short domain